MSTKTLAGLLLLLGVGVLGVSLYLMVTSPFFSPMGVLLAFVGAILVASGITLMPPRFLIFAATPATATAFTFQPNRYQLTMVSGVARVNDYLVGDFADRAWADIAGKHFLQMDAQAHPEFSSYRIDEIEPGAAR